jgi:hypothetical protein
MGSGQSNNNGKTDAIVVKTSPGGPSTAYPSWITDIGTQLKNNVEENVQRRGMLQREIQMSVNIAKARDTLQIFGSAYGVGVMGMAGAKLAGKVVPPTAMVPIVIGGVVLGNVADMAYGNKLQRVTKEAEYLMENERHRFVPPCQAPFYKYYPDADKNINAATRPVGTLFPSSLIARPQQPPSRDA